MKTATLFEKKENKQSTSSYLEIDLDDLEFYKKFEHGAEFLSFPSKKISNKTLMEWFSVNEISFWWFIAPVIHPRYKEAILFIDRLSNFLEQNSIKKLELHGCYEKIDLVKQICEHKNIELKLISKNNYGFQIRKFAKTQVKKSFYKKISKQKLDKRIKCYEPYKTKEIPKGQILITSPGIYRRSTICNDGNICNQEFFIQPILDGFKNKYSILNIDLDYTFKGTTDILEERLNSEFDWVPVDYFLSNKQSTYVDDSIKILYENFKSLQKNDLTNIFTYNGISLWNFLKKTFNDIFLEPNLPTYIHLIDQLIIFFKSSKPSLIIQVYETGPYAKAFEIAAKKLGIKTIGIQHGLFPSDFPDYMCKQVKNNEFEFGNILSDYTFVFGEYYVNLLTKKGGYPKNSVIPTGNLSLNNVDLIKQNFSRDVLLKKNQIPDTKIILVPLSFRLKYHQNNPDQLILNKIYSHFKNTETIILVRPHPGDLLDQQNFNELFPASNFVLSKNTISEDLFLCDLVIVPPISTIGSEAALYEKPTILVNVVDDDMSSYDDVYQQIVKHDVARFSSLDNLISNIESIKKGELWKTNESEKRKNFLSMFFTKGEKIDLIKIIEDILN